MARNCEKHLVRLNQVYIKQQQERDEERKRPRLQTLNTASEVKDWIPSIKRDMDYYLRQLSGARRHQYPPNKIEEFNLRVKQLEGEYKAFVQKSFKLDPNQKGVPWKAKGYVSKRKASDGCGSSGVVKTNCVGDSNDSWNSGKSKRPRTIKLRILEKEQETKENDSDENDVT